MMVAQKPDIEQFASRVVTSLVQLFGYTTDYAQLSVRSSSEFVNASYANNVEAVDVAGILACEEVNIEEAARAPVYDDN